jgi:hypothetical protein
MLPRACVVLLALLESFFALMLVAGHSQFAGRTLVRISPAHGVDAGDLPVAVFWLAAMACCAVLWRTTKPE